MIYYYSGTGNSAYVAKRLSELLEMEPVDLGARIRRGNMDPIVDGRIVLVTPTYGWRIPRFIDVYLRQLEVAADRIDFVLTCGTSVGGAAIYAKSLAEALGAAFGGLYEIPMPENYIALFEVPDAEASRKIVEDAEEKIRWAAKKIGAGESERERPGLVGNFLSRAVNGPFYAVCVKAKSFYATDACIGCGECERRCVLGNIELKDKKPRWFDRCTHCMACINYCPTEAIEYGNKTRGKFRYTFEKVKETRGDA